jgi:putative ABC transport system permease protein
MATQSGIIKYGNKKSNPNIWVRGIDENYLNVAGNNLGYGRNFSSIELERGFNVCIIGHAMAKNYFGKKSAESIGKWIILNNNRYNIVGLLAEKGSSMFDRTDNMILLPLQTVRRVFTSGSKVYNLSAKVEDIKMLPSAADEAEGQMRKIRKLSTLDANNFSIDKNDSFAEQLISNLSMVSFAAIFIGIITLIGAAIALMNIMLVAVAERTKEIGLSKAIGANKSTVRKQFLMESIYISVIGGLWGILAGIIIGNIISIVFKSAFVIPWNWIFLSVIICVVVGLLSGILPAIKASRLNPIQALQYE